MAARQNLIELCKKISHGHYPIDENCAEYKAFEKWMTDDQITVLMAMDLLSPSFVETVAEATGFSEEKTLEILRELAAEYHVPLWDFDLLAGTLPGCGLDKDNIHLVIDDLPHDYTLPETFQRGHPMQDLSALIALDQVRRIIEETN